MALLNTRRLGFGGVVAASMLALAACGGGGSDTAAEQSNPAQSKASSPAKKAAAGKPFGPACSQVPKSGPGSVKSMSTKPVATAASNNPVLTTLTKAVKQAGLVDTLNSKQNITVFAPANGAFEKIPEEDLNALLQNKEKLTKVLTYHVVGKKVTPAELASGSFKTLQGGTVETSGSNQSYTVNGNAKVVCGNVQTANATVYIIDGVLMPKMNG